MVHEGVAIDYVVPNISLATSGNEDFRDNDNNFSVSLDVFLSLPVSSFQNGNLLQLNVTVSDGFLRCCNFGVSRPR